MPAISVNKPTVGMDVDAWGRELNTALDDIVAGVNAADGLLTAAVDELGTVRIGALPDLSGVYTSAAALAATAATVATKVDKNEIVISARDYGAVGDGTTDDTAAVIAAVAAANALVRPGLVATIKHPGATLNLAGIYNLASLAAPIDIMCNVTVNNATFIIPAAYAGIAVRVGHTASGSYFVDAVVNLPDIVKPTGTLLVAGSIGCRVVNLGHAVVKFGRTCYFETGIHFTGDGQGCAYNTFDVGDIMYCQIALSLRPHLASGWVNQNTFVGGGIQQSPGYAGGTRVSGWRHLVLDGTTGNAVNGNTFLGTSFEGNVSEYWVEITGAFSNQWIGCRHDQSTTYTATTVAGDTCTTTAHGMVVGDMLFFTATTVPTGMFIGSPYYITDVPTADTFKASQKKGGTAVTFSTAGTAVSWIRPQRALLNTGTYICSDNVFRDPMGIGGSFEIVNPNASGSGNVVQRASSSVTDYYGLDSIPPFRARNRSTVPTDRAIYAAYGANTNPVEDPHGWTVAISDAGLIYAAAGAETGRLISSGGVLSWTHAGATAQIASGHRTSSLIAITALSLAANTTTSTTFTLAGAATNEHVLVTMLSNPVGVTVRGYVSAADTVTVVFANLTASVISLTCNLQAISFGRYF